MCLQLHSFIHLLPAYYGLDICMPPHMYIEILTLSVIVLEDGDFGDEGGAS